MIRYCSKRSKNIEDSSSFGNDCQDICKKRQIFWWKYACRECWLQSLLYQDQNGLVLDWTSSDITWKHHSLYKIWHTDCPFTSKVWSILHWTTISASGPASRDCPIASTNVSTSWLCIVNRDHSLLVLKAVKCQHCTHKNSCHDLVCLEDVNIWHRFEAFHSKYRNKPWFFQCQLSNTYDYTCSNYCSIQAIDAKWTVPWWEQSLWPFVRIL